MTTTRRFVLARRIILTTALGVGLLVLLWLNLGAQAAPVHQPTAPTPTPGIPTSMPAPVPLAVSAAEATCNAENVGVFTAWGQEGNGIQFPVPFATTARQFFISAHNRLKSSYGAIGKCRYTIDDQLTDATKYEACTQLSVSGLRTSLNRATVAFITGHGTPDSVLANPNAATGDPISIASLKPLGACNQNPQSALRYLLLSSCNTLAHGPRECSNPVYVPGTSGEGDVMLEYACPGEWKPEIHTSTEEFENVYTRWGPSLGNGMRMICGGSTMVTPSTADNMWTNQKQYGKDGVMVADAFVNALSVDDYVGLCIARGGSDFSQSPLMTDTLFETAANPFDDGPDVYYHTQYGRSFAPGTSPVHFFAAPLPGALSVTGLPFAQGYSPVRGIIDNRTLITATGASLQTVSKVMPRCLPAVHSSGIATSFVPLAPQIQQLVAYSSELDALSDQAENESRYVSAVITEVNRRELGAGLFTLRPEYVQGWHNMVTMVPADPEQWNVTALRVAEKNVVVNFPQLVRLDEVQTPIIISRSELTTPTDSTPQQLLLFYENLAATYPTDATGTQPWANLIEPITGIPLLPIRDREFTARINPDHSIIDYSYRIERILPDDQSSETYRTVTPYDAFLYSLNRLCNLSKLTEQDAAPISQQMSFDAILKGCNRAFEQQTGGNGFPYRLRSWNWGYAPPQAEDGGKMKLFYRFEYVPDIEAGFSAEQSPAIMIWVQGQSEKEGCS